MSDIKMFIYKSITCIEWSIRCGVGRGEKLITCSLSRSRLVCACIERTTLRTCTEYKNSSEQIPRLHVPAIEFVGSVSVASGITRDETAGLTKAPFTPEEESKEDIQSKNEHTLKTSIMNGKIENQENNK